MLPDQLVSLELLNRKHIDINNHYLSYRKDNNIQMAILLYIIMIIQEGTSDNRIYCSPHANKHVPSTISNRQTSNGTWDNRKLHPLKRIK